MELSKEDLQWAASQGIITPQQADALWRAFEARGSSSAFNFANVAYYFGAMIVIAAMGWLMNTAWEEFGGGGILILAVLYAVLFAWAGYSLWLREDLQVPGGLLFTMAVCMTPLAIYGLERLLGMWPQGAPANYRDYHIWVKGSWVFMELGTIAAGLLALRFVRFPFLTAPIAFSLWYMSMDLTPIFFGKDEFSWTERLWVSLLFGMLMLAAAYLMDHRTQKDYSFWLYMFGMFAFWGGLSLMESGSEWGKFVYCLINLSLIVASVFLERRVFLVFGALGVNGYLGYLAYRVFSDSILFPFVLVFLGIAIIFMGVQYQRNRNRLEGAVLDFFPESLRQLRPANRTAR